MPAPRTAITLASAVIASGVLLVACGSTQTSSTAPTTTAPESRPTDAAADRSAIAAALDAWPGAWASRDADAVCDLFAPDVVFSFQGGEDRDYEQACAQFKALTADREKAVSYERPEIESIAVDGDLAAVRLIWTFTVTRADDKVLDTGREKGLDVFERQDDGAWRIAVSFAYPLE